ncbi:hypothetical protein L3Y34_006566 [Caenorhabditis briggsae]|uniref:Uncharacterized protein n=1 Tax=Caenorhabditis briggsae TaxID=6238 RepID=A0AAE9CY16_CAEBR|nr:hypothetical protein L3Y34_006566 [Caenorhabditis briggsae]
MDAAESVVMVLHTVFLVFLVWYSYKKNEEFTSIVIITGFLYAIPITVAYLENNDFMNLFNSYPNVHLYHYAPEIFIPVTVTVLSIEWKKKIVPVVTAH